MTALKEWLLGVIGASLLLGLVLGMFPKGKYQAIGSFMAGTIMLLVLIQPLPDLTISTWDEIADEMTLHRDAIVLTEQETLCAVISEKTAAYIQDKASSLGVKCRAEVRCTEREGVPFPEEVWLDTAYCAPLSDLITADLGIEKDRQYWQEGAS